MNIANSFPTSGLSFIRDSRSAIDVVEALIRKATSAQASDIHLDPQADSFTARFRIDGILHDAQELPQKIQHEILARLKILAELRIDEHQAPQDGRFKFRISENQTVDVRISIAPTYYGESAVLRLLSPSNTLTSLTSLGFNRTHQEMVTQALLRPHGMILVTGPTGGGKTSTLYTLLQLLNTRAVSIITIEDPIEYALSGITQIPVTRNQNSSTSLTFANGLRSVLRLDPDIIGLGEIRDNETASLATNAALTGHLVLSTLHTTDAPTTLPRLLEMGVEPYLLSSTISLVINQRLAKKLCSNCKKKKPLRKDQKALIALISGPLQTCNERYESSGCEKCNGTGIQGRIGIFEIMRVDEELREAVMKKASMREIYSLALARGMTPLLHDGIRKAAEGSVNLDEILALMTE